MINLETLIIEKLDGTRLEINELDGACLLSVSDGGPQPSTQYENISGVDGNLAGTTTFGTRPIIATFYFKGADKIDYTLAQKEIWRVLFDYEPYYITWTRLPGLRYLVQCKPFTDTRINPITGTYEVEFEAFTGFAESRGRTDIDPINMDSDVWQIIGQGLILDSDLIYTHTTSSFSIFNAGDISIDPAKPYHELTITIKGSGKPTLKNNTTGDVFTYNKTLTPSDTLIIDGVYPYVNGAHCGRDTNHGLIRLTPGWNKLSLTGLSNRQITFGFRFLYK